jgi:hypothetical protein
MPPLQREGTNSRGWSQGVISSQGKSPENKEKDEVSLPWSEKLSKFFGQSYSNLMELYNMQNLDPKSDTAIRKGQKLMKFFGSPGTEQKHEGLGAFDTLRNFMKRDEFSSVSKDRKTRNRGKTTQESTRTRERDEKSPENPQNNRGLVRIGNWEPEPGSEDERHLLEFLATKSMFFFFFSQ